MSGNVDLFGDPVPEAWGRRGRPAHVPTQANRDKVSMLLALGWSNERIANAIAVSLPTLRKCYRFELKVRDIQRDRLDARLAEKLFEGVNAGNVGAVKEFRKLLEKNDQMMSEATFKQRAGKKEEPRQEKLGKKAMRQAKAEEQTKQGRFAVPQPPRMIQ